MGCSFSSLTLANEMATNQDAEECQETEQFIEQLHGYMAKVKGESQIE